MELWLEQYGCWAVFLGIFIEGPVVLTLAGFLVHQGYLNAAAAAAAALAGTFILVEVSYLAGLAGGQYLLARRPAWRLKLNRFSELLTKHRALFMLGFRFIHGAQVISAMAIGIGRIRPGYFSAMNAAGGVIYVAVFMILGYVFGHSIELLIEDIKQHEKPLALALVALMLVYYLVRRIVWRRLSPKHGEGVRQP